MAGFQAGDVFLEDVGYCIGHLTEMGQIRGGGAKISKLLRTLQNNLNRESQLE
jgi:hypothetical protein